MKNELLLRLFTLAYKHGKHDQSSHGRRQGGGGLAPAVMGARPKKAVPSAGQLSLFDMDMPTPSTSSTPLTFSANRLAEVHKSIDASTLSDADKTRLKQIATSCAQSAERVNAERQRILYPNGVYVGADPAIRMSMHDVAWAEGKALSQELKTAAEQLVWPKGNTDLDMPMMSRSGYKLETQSAMQADRLLAECATLAFLQPTPANVSIEMGFPGGTGNSNVDNMPTIKATVTDQLRYVHIAPDDLPKIQISDGAANGSYFAPPDANNPVGDIRIQTHTKEYSAQGITFVTRYSGEIARSTRHEVAHYIGMTKQQSGTVVAKTADAAFGNNQFYQQYRRNWTGKDDNPNTLTEWQDAGLDRPYGVPYANNVYGKRDINGTRIVETEVASTTIEFLFASPYPRGGDQANIRSIVLRDGVAFPETFAKMHY